MASFEVSLLCCVHTTLPLLAIVKENAVVNRTCVVEFLLAGRQYFQFSFKIFFCKLLRVWQAWTLKRQIILLFFTHDITNLCVLNQIRLVVCLLQLLIFCDIHPIFSPCIQMPYALAVFQDTSRRHVSHLFYSCLWDFSIEQESVGKYITKVIYITWYFITLSFLPVSPVITESVGCTIVLVLTSPQPLQSNLWITLIFPSEVFYKKLK